MAERSYEDALWDLVSPGPKRAEAWDLGRIMKRMPPETAKGTWEGIKTFVERMAPRALGEMGRDEVAALGGERALGKGVSGSVYLYKPKDHGPLAIKFGNIKPDTQYERFKGVPPILKTYETYPGAYGKAAVMPYIPGNHPFGSAPRLYGMDVYKGAPGMDMLNLAAEASKSGFRPVDVHTANQIIVPRDSALGGRNFMVDRGALARENPAGRDVFREALNMHLQNAGRKPRSSNPMGPESAQSIIDLLRNTEEGSKMWPDLFELLYEAPETRRFLP